MSTLEVWCVCVGDKYPEEYVTKLKNMVARNLPQKHTFHVLRNGDGLQGWWAKMQLFNPKFRTAKTLYFDLDTIILKDISALAAIDDFSICANFTKEKSPTYPCKYGSCVMVIPEGYGKEIWDIFNANRQYFINQCGSYGDQKAIEIINPNAKLLQKILPKGYFLGYRDFKQEPDGRAHIAIFAGKRKPHNEANQWLTKHWK